MRDDADGRHGIQLGSPRLRQSLAELVDVGLEKGRIAPLLAFGELVVDAGALVGFAGSDARRASRQAAIALGFGGTTSRTSSDRPADFEDGRVVRHVEAQAILSEAGRMYLV